MFFKSLFFWYLFIITSWLLTVRQNDSIDLFIFYRFVIYLPLNWVNANTTSWHHLVDIVFSQSTLKEAANCRSVICTAQKDTNRKHFEAIFSFLRRELRFYIVLLRNNFTPSSTPIPVNFLLVIFLSFLSFPSQLS